MSLSQFDTYLTTPAFGNALPAYRSMSCKARSARSAQPLELDSCDQPAPQAWLIGEDRAVMLDSIRKAK
jgi:hypothetical protein